MHRALRSPSLFAHEDQEFEHELDEYVNCWSECSKTQNLI